MKLELIRKYKKPNYTIGNLYIDGKYFCDTLEDVDRGLDSNDENTLKDNIKIKHNTAIPYGTYNIDMDIVSNRFGKHKQYRNINGKLPRLIDVPLFDGILIHIGNTIADTSGCLLVGQNKVKGQVINSTSTFNHLYVLMEEAYKKGEDITIEIKA